MKASEFINSAKQYLNVKFLHQGRNEFGLDCWGLIWKAAKDNNVALTDRSNYSRIPDGKVFTEVLLENADSVSLSDIRNGDLVLFRVKRFPQHSAIYEDGYVIHACSDCRKVIRTVLTDVLKKKITGCYRLRCIDG